MSKQPDGNTLRERLNAPVRLGFLNRGPGTTVDKIAFCALAAFFLFPVVLALLTMRHFSFDRMIDESMAMLDWGIFPFVTLCAALAYVLTLRQMRREKRSPLAELRENPTLILFALLLVWMCVNFFILHPVPGGLFNGLMLRHESFSLILEYYLGFFALGMALRDERLKLWLLRGLTGVSVFLVPCAFFLRLHLTTELYSDWRPTLDAIFTNPNYYGYFLSVVVGLCAGLFAAEERPRWCVFYAFALALNAVALGFNGTRGAWIGASFACLFLVIACRVRDGRFQRRSLIALGIFLVALSVTTYYGNASRAIRLVEDVQTVMRDPSFESAAHVGGGRWRIWIRCLEILRDNALFGIGFEGLYVWALDEYATNTRPHNEFLQYALFYGIPAGILYIAGCTSVYLRAVRRRARLDGLTLAALAGAFGYLIGSFFGVTVYNTAPFLFIMLGLGYVHADAKPIPAHADAVSAPADAAAVSAHADAVSAPADADANAVSSPADAKPISAPANKKRAVSRKSRKK